jgi:MraZ protein
MFLGQYEHGVDEKGRLTIPVRFRDGMIDGAYIIQGFDRNLMVLTSASFDLLSERVNQKSLTDPAARMLRRLIFSSADRVEVDKAGRILIPQFLRDANDLNGAAIVVGTGDYFEIWSKDLWADQQVKLQDVEANEQRFAALDLSAI